MGRRSSGGRRSSSGKPLFSSSKSSNSASTTPAAKTSAPAPVAKQPSSGGGFLSAVADGLFFGGGNAIAHRAMDAIMGPRVIQHEHVGAPAPVATSASLAQAVPNNATPEACVGQVKAFEECLNSSGNDISRCQFYMDMLTECRKSGSASVAY